MGVKCPKCNTDNPDTQKFCGECATPLPSSEEVSVARTKTLETPVQRLKKETTFAERYEVLEELGKGGMGEVYRVKDKKLDEEIALKVLKTEIAADKGMIERFKNELKFARKIAHRNVCKMYDLNEEEGMPYITMEYVKGEDLKSLIRKKEKLTEGEVITIAKQVCEGLAEAHGLGVVHRDLKPQNIIIDEKSNAKIMDFGIARSIEAPGITQTGVIIGTPDYISPEQAEGEEVDRRSDIYSLGVILFEMVTGSVPFRGDTAFSVALKHKTEAPQYPRKLNPQVSEDLSRLILKCMEKDKEKRYQSAREAHSALDRIEKGIPLEETPSKVKSIFFFLKERKIIGTLAAFIGAGVAIVEFVHHIIINHYDFPKKTLDITIVTLLSAMICTLIWRFFSGIERKKRKLKIEYVVIPVIILITAFFDIQLVQKISISEEEVTREVITPIQKQLTFTGNVSYSAIAPDGKFIAYVDRITPVKVKVVVHDLISGNSIEVFNAESCSNLCWSPDSSELAFSASTQDYGLKTFIISRLGGSPQILDSMPNLDWSPDGSIFVYSYERDKQIRFLNRTTGDSTSIPIKGRFDFIRGLDFSPSGNLITFTTYDLSNDYSAIWTITTDGSKQHKIVEDKVRLSSPRWSPTGNAIYYLRLEEKEGELWKISVSKESGKSKKSSYQVLSGMQAGLYFSITNDSNKLLYLRHTSSGNLWLLSIEGAEKQQTINKKQITTGNLYHRHPSISPDGRFVAYSKGDHSSTNIYVMPIEGGNPRQITFTNSHKIWPVWSPDGKEIAFGSDLGGVYKLWKVSANGGTPHQFEDSELHSFAWLSWSPGSNILYFRPDEKTGCFLNPATGEESLITEGDITGGDSNVLIVGPPLYSPDGKRIVICIREFPGLYIVTLKDFSRVLIKESYFYPLGWSSDGEWIYGIDSQKFLKFVFELRMISINNKRLKTVLSMPFVSETYRPLFEETSMASNGKHFVFPVFKEPGDLWVVENFDPEIK